MENIGIINFENVSEKEIENFKYRLAVRAVLFNEENKVALLDVSNENYHKLPGGGVEKEEDLKTALKRECLEETGRDIEILKEIGSVIEYRRDYQLKLESKCYISKTIGNKKETSFTKDEIKRGFKLLWVDLDEAINILENDFTQSYAGKFILKRDLIFLKESKKII